MSFCDIGLLVGMGVQARRGQGKEDKSSLAWIPCESVPLVTLWPCGTILCLSILLPKDL